MAAWRERLNGPGERAEDGTTGDGADRRQRGDGSGLETSATINEALSPWLGWLDKAIVAVFVVEIAARLVAEGPAFFRRGWNLFDFAVISITLIPATGNLSVLRALRILRVLRLVSVVPQMRKVVEALLHAIPGLGSISSLLLLVFYVGAVMATRMFGEAFPEWFGSVGASMYSLFQIMTLESWSMGIVRPVMGNLRLGVGLLRAFHPADELRGAEPLHRCHRRCHADPAHGGPGRDGGGAPAGDGRPKPPSSQRNWKASAAKSGPSRRKSGGQGTMAVDSAASSQPGRHHLTDAGHR